MADNKTTDDKPVKKSAAAKTSTKSKTKSNQSEAKSAAQVEAEPILKASKEALTTV